MEYWAVLRAVFVVSTIAATCGAAAGQTVTCLERNVVGELYGKVQIKREGDVRTFTDWTITDGREREPTSMDIPVTSVLQYEPWDWTDRDDDYDWEQINLDRSGNPWFLIVDYGVPLMIYGGYAKGMENPPSALRATTALSVTKHRLAVNSAAQTCGRLAILGRPRSAGAGLGMPCRPW